MKIILRTLWRFLLNILFYLNFYIRIYKKGTVQNVVLHKLVNKVKFIEKLIAYEL